MRKRLALLFAVTLLGIGATAPSASAAGVVATSHNEDGGTDYGWIGLLGLAGLAGLLGRKRDTRDHDRTPDRR